MCHSRLNGAMKSVFLQVPEVWEEEEKRKMAAPTQNALLPHSCICFSIVDKTHAENSYPVEESPGEIIF